MIPNWAIKPHIKGDTFNSRKFTFPFDITNCIIEMQFKVTVRAGVSFAWSTEDDTFEKISSTELIMKSRILDAAVSGYISDLQVTFDDGVIYTYLRANLQILQDVTT